MADLGTLVTVVTVDASGFHEGLGKVSQGAEKFKKDVDGQVASASKWGEEIKKLVSKFSSLSGIMKIGFGIGGAGALLSIVHHGLQDLAGGFMDSMNAGQGFFQSIGDGISNMVGLETHLQQVTKDAEAYRKIADQLRASELKGIDIVATAQGRPTGKEFGNLPNADAAEAHLEQLKKDARAAAEAAAPFREDVRKKQAEFEVAKRGENFGALDVAIAPLLADDLADARIRAKQFIAAQEKAERALREYEETMKEADKVAGSNTTAFEEQNERLAANEAERQRNLRMEELRAKIENEQFEKDRKAADELRRAQEAEAKRHQSIVDRITAGTRTPEERLQMGLAELTGLGADIDPRTRLRRELQLQEEFDKSKGGGGAAFGGIAELNKQFQLAATKRGDSPEVIAIKKQLAELEKNRKAVEAGTDKVVAAIEGNANFEFA